MTTRSRIILPETLDIPEFGIPNFVGTEAANGPCLEYLLFVKSTEEGNGASKGPNKLSEDADFGISESISWFCRADDNPDRYFGGEGGELCCEES